MSGNLVATWADPCLQWATIARITPGGTPEVWSNGSVVSLPAYLRDRGVDVGTVEIIPAEYLNRYARENGPAK